MPTRTVSPASAPALRPYEGPAFLGQGFRPFFLAGAIHAAVAIPVWLLTLFGRLRIPTAFSPVDWHAHEMLYGYVPAIVAGYLLTTTPNWTRRLPSRGGPLAVLVLTWLTGRLAVAYSAPIGPVLAAGLDLSFLLLVAAAAAREAIVGRDRQNLAPVGVLAALVMGNLLFHLEAHRHGSADLGKRIGIAATITLIVLIGGRVIPSFTRHWLARENPGRLPASFGRVDVIVSIVSTAALVSWVAMPGLPVTAALMWTAGIVQTARLLQWAGDRTLGNGLLLMLHVAYAFVPLGSMLAGAAIVFPGHLSPSAGIHAWGVGAIGCMTLGMMTRVSLSYTGRKPVAGPTTLVVFAALLAAALLRVGEAFGAVRSPILLGAAGVAWMAAFLLFVVSFAPKLARARMSASDE